MGLFEFSWTAISLIDIGVLSFVVIGLWRLKNQLDQCKLLYEKMDQQFEPLDQKQQTLRRKQQTFRRSNTEEQESKGRYNLLQEKQDSLKTEIAIFRTELETVTQKHKILKWKYDTMQAGIKKLVINSR